MHIIVIETIRALPDKNRALKQALLQLVPLSLQEKECLHYEVTESTTHNDTFMILMRWESMTGLDAHNASPHIASFVKNFENILYDKNEVSETLWYNCSS